MKFQGTKNNFFQVFVNKSRSSTLNYLRLVRSFNFIPLKNIQSLVPCFKYKTVWKVLFWISVTTSNVENFWLVTNVKRRTSNVELQTSNVKRRTSNVKRRNQWLFVRSDSTKNVSKMISTKILVFLSVLQGKNFI